jgi:hypothetical protein
LTLPHRPSARAVVALGSCLFRRFSHHGSRRLDLFAALTACRYV